MPETNQTVLNVKIEEKNYQVQKGSTILQAMQELGVPGVNAVCNGQGTCGKCNVYVDDMLMKACEYVLKRDCRIRLLHSVTDNRKNRDETYLQPGKVLAVDVGTTNICYQRIEEDGEITKENYCPNPQQVYGADVIHRIQASNEGKQSQLHKMLMGEVEKIIDKMPAKQVIISANTTMRYFLENRNPESLGFAPYHAGDISWGRIGYKENQCEMIPGISAFVGGDIVSGIYALNMMHLREDENTLHPIASNSLLIDLGTNGEMALSYKGKLYVGSAPAGPAFETEQFGYGSTLIAVCARMLQQGKIDENGNLLETMEPLQTEIRNLQLGKSAIRAGAETILQEASAKWEEIEIIYLAGNFGEKLDKNDVCEIGLLPKELSNQDVKKRIVAVGNTSLCGAIRYGLHPKEKEQIDEIVKKAQVVNLAESTYFADKFMEYMFFDTNERTE